MMLKIETHLIKALEALKLGKVVSYGGALTEGAVKTKAGMDKIFIIVTFDGDFKAPTKNSSGVRVHRRYSIAVTFKSSKNEEEARQQAYRAIDTIQASITGQTLGLDIQPIELGPVDVLVTENDKQYQNSTIMNITADTSYTVDNDIDLVALADLNTLSTSGSLHANVKPNS